METLISLTLSGSALALLLLLLGRLLGRRLPSTVYYYAWLLVLLRFLLPLPGLLPLGQRAAEPAAPVRPALIDMGEAEAALPYISQTPAEAPAALPAALPEEAAPAQESASVPAAPAQPAARGFSVDWRSPRLWLTLWALGAGACFLWPIVSYLRFIAALRRRLTKPGRELRRRYAALPGKKPRLSLCPALQTPLMFGVFAPRIVLPQELAEEPELLDNVLRHELCHYRRRDPLYKWFAAAVLALHWFNPLSWLIRRELNRACELSCDETLLRSMDRAEKQAYGETLLRMAAGAALPAGVVATTFSTEKKNLKERLEQIMNYNKTKGRALAALLALLLLCGCGVAAGPSEGQDASLVPKEETVVEVSTVDELLAAIRPHTTVVLAPGEYDLSTAADYGHISENPYIAWVQVPQADEKEPGFELQILGAEGLTLRGAGEGETSLAAVPRYANVLHFLNCREVRLEGLTAGHTPAPGYCMGGVLYFDACNDVTVDACGLYGCGTIGVQGRDCTNLNVTGCHIYECSYGAVVLHSCRKALVEGCEIERNGLKPETGPAYNLFTADFTEDITVLNCRVHDNLCQTLLNTDNCKNTLFLSNRVEKNDFQTCLFQLHQVPATVDGCAFTDNETPAWVYGSILPIDMEGKALAAAELQAMEYRELDPAAVKPAQPAAAALELPVGGSVTVTTVDEFLAAIGPDRTILLDGELFDLSTASNYGGVGGAYYYWLENHDGPELMISGVSGLTIRSVSEDPAATTLAAVPRYANVLRFRDCEHINLVGFTAGHTQEPGSCSGGVLYFSNCHGVGLEACRLYGCGILGLSADGCTDLTLRDCEIYDCSQGGVHLARTDGVRFLNCDIHDVPSPALNFFNCGDLSWNGAPMTGNRFDVAPDGTLQDLSVPAAQGEGSFYVAFSDENSDPAWSFYPRGLQQHPYELLMPGRFREANGTREFAREVQKNIAEGNWEALSGQLYYPFTLCSGSFTRSIPDAETFLAQDLDTLIPPDFRERIAADPLESYGIDGFGNSFCGGYLAFARSRDARGNSGLCLTFLSTEEALTDYREDPFALHIFCPSTEESELVLNPGVTCHLSAQAEPLGLYPDLEYSWTVSDPSALRLTPGERGVFCKIEALQLADSGLTVTVTARFHDRDFSRTLTVYIVDPDAAFLPPTPAPAP
jgi:beta-lactamase regulating signal transducer with metallopeptidase domain